jgi:hypothetical protein
MGRLWLLLLLLPAAVWTEQHILLDSTRVRVCPARPYSIILVRKYILYIELPRLEIRIISKTTYVF